MKAGLKINKMLAACVVALAAPAAFAQTITVSETNAGTNSTANSTVTIDRQGATVNGFVFELDYDVTRLSLGPQHVDPGVQHPRVTNAPGNTGAADFGCVENVIGTLRCVASSAPTSATFGAIVNFTTLAVEGVAPLTIDPAQSNYVNAAFVDTAFAAIDDGSITLTNAPANPTDVILAPTTVNLANGGNVAGQQSAPSDVSVTTGGAGLDPGSYSCTVPAGFTLTPAANPNIPAGSNPEDITVTCTLDAAAFQGTSVCTINGGTDPDVNLTLNCPAPAGPVLASNPPTGTPLTCNGTPGSATTTSVTISNTGTAQMTGVTCNVTAGFTIETAPSPTVNAGASTTVVVGCTPPADTDPPTTGTLSCTTTAPAGGALTFPVSSDGIVVVAPSQPETIPSTSLWAKIGLFGLLAALGTLVIGFRRHS